MKTIDRITIKGFKSIRKLEDFPLRPLNVLIGANGAGKSNFIGFFRLLRDMIEQRLQLALQATEGGADGCLYLGPKITPTFTGNLYFGSNGYEFTLVPTTTNKLVFLKEEAIYVDSLQGTRKSLGSGHMESVLKDHRNDHGLQAKYGVPYYVYGYVSGFVVYHFHDTGLSAGVRRPCALNDNETFRPNAENLAPFLYRIQKTNPSSYAQIRDVIRLAAPFFDDFHLRPIPDSPDMIQLEWRQVDSDYNFRAHQLSDGTLRFICLATALLQPFAPSTVLFDEPELGLHPYALTLFGNLCKQAIDAGWRQIIISTQSAQLLNEFAPEDIIVVERTNGESTFRRLDASHLNVWLEDYTMGELWLKNVLGGRPREEYITQPVNGSGLK